MITEYILDLDKEEYRDDFVSNENNEFWQFEARDSLIEKLTTTLNDAKNYKIARQEKPNKTWLSHNAILVSGQRGTGKTVFLRNCEDIWRNNDPNTASHEQSDLYFLQEIDPTMLINEDNFSNVVVAQIYSEVERKLQSEIFCKNLNAGLEQNKNTFHKALKKLADSLGKQDDFNGLTGIDKIQQYKSGIHIQTYFNEFIEAAINILGCSALVLPIDDVDMALDRAFEVVDDVRRLLGCPYIIPIVSGDYRLYSQMTNVHFDKKSYRDKSKNEELRYEGQELAKQLSNAYLTKVFPNQMRITLLPIMYITPTLIIKQKNYDGKATNYKYKDYKHDLLQHFYPLCHNKEVLESWPEPESARELTQLMRAMSPKTFKKSLSKSSPKAVTKDDRNTKNKLWKSYINWAEQKQNGVAFTNANSYLSLANRDSSDYFDIQVLPNFNPMLQMKKELYPWAKKDFYKSQLTALKFSKSASTIKENKSLLDSAFDDSSLTLRSMPPLEFTDLNSFVSLRTIKNISTDNKESLSNFLILKEGNAGVTSSREDNNFEEITSKKSEGKEEVIDTKFQLDYLLLNIYTHGEVYTKLANNLQYVFMSRAFEIIFYSFVNNDEPKKQEENLLRILRKTPFYSVFNMAPTKVIDGEGDDGQLSFGSLTSELENYKVTSANILQKLINDWRQCNKGCFEDIEPESLVSIFSYIFNKVFTSLNVFKAEHLPKSSANEHLTDYSKRFEYMFINSAYTAAIKGVAVQANVGFTDNHNTIRSASAFKSSDRVLTRNRDIFEKEIELADKTSTDDTADLFIKALEEHPIFKLIQQHDNEIGITIPEKIKMGKVDIKNNKEKLPPAIYEAVTDFLIENPSITKKGVVTVSSIKKRLQESEEEIVEKIWTFYDENEEGFRNVYENNSKQITGKKEHNFIVALIDLMDSEEK